jgi:hypothetical protein
LVLEQRGLVDVAEEEIEIVAPGDARAPERRNGNVLDVLDDL